MLNVIVAKPWGSYQILLDDHYTKVKKIIVKPKQSLSYQYNFKRSEVWVIVGGNAKIKLDGEDRYYDKGDTINIPVKSKHLIANESDEDLIFIEVQSGEYFGEDDIMRLEDNLRKDIV